MDTFMCNRLYDWQEECLDRWFANNGRGIVQAVTGSGKTLLALTAARRLEKTLDQKLHIKIVVPTGALMRQWNRDLREFLSVPAPCMDSGRLKNAGEAFRDKIGMRGGGFKSSTDCQYMIYVINSARYELARQILSELKKGDAVLLIADECHHYESGQNKLIFEFLPYIKQYEDSFFSLGLSATLPYGHYLPSVLGKKIYHYGMKEAAVHHTVCRYDVYHISLSFQKEEQAEYEELSERISFLYSRLLKFLPSANKLGTQELFDQLRGLTGSKNKKLAQTASMYMNLSYRRKSLVCSASARVSCACELVRRLEHTKKILIFSERISQAEELYRILQEYEPEKVGRFHSKMGEQANKNSLERFRTGAIRILIACKAIDEGIDIPDASVGIILSGTSSKRQRIQRLGRIIRMQEQKNHATLYYLHIEESSEDSCFLPDAEIDHLFQLEYHTETHDFSHPLYEEKAKKLLDEIQCTDISEEKLQEVHRCLKIGCVRSDWMLKDEDKEMYLKNAKYISEKNYWSCMKRLECY